MAFKTSWFVRVTALCNSRWWAFALITFAPPAPADGPLVCTSPGGAETRKLFSTFSGARQAPCKVNYETPSGTRIAADAKFDVNKCITVVTSIKKNLEHVGWTCHGGDAPPAAAPTPQAAAATPTAPAATPTLASRAPAAASQSTLLSDRAAVNQLSHGPWAEECLYHYPAKWKRNAELSDGELDVYPGPGDPLAKHNFVFSVGNARFSHLDRVFVAGKDMSWEEAQTYATTMKRQDFDAAVNLRSKYPGQFIAQHVLDGLVGGAEEEFEKRGTLELRGHYVSDGRSLTTAETVSILLQDQLLIASTVFLPMVSHEPSIAEDPLGFTFSCSALNTIDLEAFRELCKMLIEKATLNVRNTEGECEYSAAGRLEFSKR